MTPDQLLAELRAGRDSLAADLGRMDAAIAALDPPAPAAAKPLGVIDIRADEARDTMLKVTTRPQWQAASVAKATTMAPTTAGRAIRRLIERGEVREVDTTRTGAPIVEVVR